MSFEVKDRFKKPFLGSKPTQSAVNNVSKAVQSGFLITAGVHAGNLADTQAPYALGIGTFAFVNPKTGLSVISSSTEVTTGKMLMLVNSSFHTNDQLGTHGGYKESIKSRGINPRNITGFKKITCAIPETSVAHLGNTNFSRDIAFTISDAGTGYTNGSYTNVPVTGGTGTGMTVDVSVVGTVVTVVSVRNPGVNYSVDDSLTLGVIPGVTAASEDATFTLDSYQLCRYEFFCDQTYDLQISLGGQGVLSVLNHEVPRGVSAYGGCCPVDPEADKRIDSTLIFIQWAQRITEVNYFAPFIRPIVYDQLGAPLFATAAEAVAAGYASSAVWSEYVSPGYITNTLGGIRFNGAYTDTTFSNCTFQYSESTGIVSPVLINDMSITSDATLPCKDTLCFVHETHGFLGQGFGEDVVREFIDDAPRRTNMFAEDLRFREIENGNLLSSFNRNGLYTRYIIDHFVPHYENNETTFSDVNFELNIYIPCSGGTTPTVTAFETFMNAWLTSVNSTVALETNSHTPFVYSAI